MPWAFTTVSATTTGNTSAAANATTAVGITLVGNYGITQTLATTGAASGSSISFSSTPSTAPVVGVTFLNGGTLHTVTGYTAPTITFTPALTSAIASGASITLNPALYPQALVVLTGSVTATVSGSVSSGTTVTITAAGSTGNNFNSTNATSDYVGATFTAGGVTYTVTSATSTVLTVTPTITTTITGTINLTRQAVYYCRSVSSAPNSVVSIYQVNAVFAGTPIPGITVPAVATGTSLTFYNPIFQQGTDTTIGTALAGLASIRSNVINAFVDHPSGGSTAYPIGAVQIRIDDGNGVVPAIRPSAPSTFIHNGDCYRVTSWDEANRLITFSPPLVVALTNDTPLSIVTPGVISNRNVRYSNTASTDAGLDSYLVNSIGVRVLGTLTWNAWAEQLILGSTCAPYDTSQAQLTNSGLLTLNGSRSGWGLGSGSVCPTPALIANLDGTGGSFFTSVLNASGSTITLNNVSIQVSAAIDIRVGTVNFNNATIVNSQGRTSLGTALITSANTSIDKLTLSGFRWFPQYTANVTLQSIVFDNATPLFVSYGLYFSEYISFSSINSGGNADITFRNDSAPTIGRYGSIFTNALLGGAITYSFGTDLSNASGGLILARKDVAHSVKNITGANLSDVKVYLSDSLNGNHFDWQNRGIGLPTITISSGGGTGAAAIPSSIVNGVIQSIQVIAPGSGYTSTPTVTISAPASGTTATVSAGNITVSGNTITAIAVGNGGNGYTLNSLGADWNGSATKSYLWTISQGLGVSQRVILSTIITPNTRGVTNLSARITTAANINDNQIQVDNRSGGLFSSPPQINGCFSVGTSRHIITGFSINGTTSYTLTITPNLVASVAANTNILIENSVADYRNKTNIAAFVDNAAGYNAGATSILIDNGSGARTAIQPTVNSNFTYDGTYHNVTAVGSGTANKWQLTIQPGLSASLPDNTPITLRNIAGQDFYDFRTASYPHLPQGQELNLTGTGTLTNTWTLLDDATITQSNKATVDGYTTLTTAAQVYDRAKSWWYDNFETLTVSQQGAVLVTRSGTTLNAGNYDLTLATSGSVFTFSGNTITINAPTFTDTLTTTGTITLNNPSTSQVNYASGIVPAGGTVALAVAGTYDLSGWTFASTGLPRTISNTSGGAVIVWLNPNQVANVTGSGASLSIVAKPQSLAAPNLADGTRAYAARVQTFTIASTAIDTSTDTITLGNDSQGKAAVFATAAPWTQVAFRLAPGATLPATTGNVLKDGGFYYWSGGKLYTSIANIPGTPVDFTSQGANNTATPPVLATLQAETELFNTTVSGGSGLSQSLTQPDGILIRFKATKWSESAGNASATQFLDTRDSLITWSAFTGATVSSTLELEAVHEQIVATSYVQSGKYGQLFPAKRGDQFGGKFGIALEGVGTLQINADDDSSNPAGVELLQDIFLWWCWVRSTEAGIRLASYDTLTAINFTTYQAGRVEVENTDATIPLIIAGGSISFAGSSNGIAATSNAIYLNVDVLGVVAITGVAAADIRSAVGLGSANLDSQLGDITALVL